MSEGGSRRRRGGQPGNINAVKHGFYSRQFKDVELQDLDATMEQGLENEIALVRVSMRRVFELATEAENSEEPSLETWTNLLGVLGMGATRLAGLLKAQRMLGGGEDAGISAAISQALAEVTAELGINR